MLPDRCTARSKTATLVEVRFVESRHAASEQIIKTYKDTLLCVRLCQHNMCD